MVLFGIDSLLQEISQHRSTRFAMLTNDAARTARDSTLMSRLALQRSGAQIIRLFSPEHGIAAAAPDGEPVPDGVDPQTHLPIVSLYGAIQKPPQETLRDIDIVLFDIPDAGSRFYTYIWTLSYFLEACAEAGKPLWILDRPNPIGGDLSAAEGPMLDESRFSTFVGRWTMPIRHCLTLGELAQFWRAQKNIDVELRVFRASGWQRSMHWPGTQLPFIPPSPAMISYLTALIYPGTCLIEGANLSEGRGTPEPFRTIGAPWIDAPKLVESINGLSLPGLRVRPIDFTPTRSKWSGELCHGIFLEITDPRALRPVAAGLHLIAEIQKLHPEKFEFLESHFDRLVGQSDVRPQLPNQIPSTDVQDWPAQVQSHLLYA